MNEYNIEQIEKLRIHELRDYARTIGVPSPTTMNKDVLLDKIREVFERKNLGLLCHDSDTEIDFFSLLKVENSKVLSKLIDLEAKSDKKLSRQKKNEQESAYKETLTWAVAQNEAVYTSECEICEGYLDIHPEGYGIVRKCGYVPSDNDVYVTEALVKKKNLKKGSLVKGKAKVIVASKPKIMYEITYDDSNINRCDVSFDSIPYSPIGECITLNKDKFQICRGQRLYIKDMDFSSVLSVASELANEKNCYAKVVNFRALPENNYTLDSKTEIVNIPFNKSEVETLNTIELVVERIKREAELGKSNVLFLYGFSDIVRAFSVAMEGVYDFSRVNARAVGKIKNILYTAKNVNDKLHVSIVCVDKNGIKNDLKDVFEYEILPLFNSVR